MIRKIPTSADIYLEVDGVKVAVVQSYRDGQTRKVMFSKGNLESDVTEETQDENGTAYVLELSRLYATDDAIRDGIDFAALDGFSLVINKPDRSIIYYDCQWQELSESAEVGGMVLEQVSIVAGHRTELPH